MAAVLANELSFESIEAAGGVLRKLARTTIFCATGSCSEGARSTD